MPNPVIKTFVRGLFLLTSRERALNQALTSLEAYRRLAGNLGPEAAGLPFEVPPMNGIDEDMRRWSFHMILEHNAIVNRSISAIVEQLARSEPLSGAALIDPKTDVMPSSAAGPEQLKGFESSVNDHVRMVRGLGRLRGTRTEPHPIFGPFDAHQWNCIFSFHLGLHYRQAAHVAEAARAIAP